MNSQNLIPSINATEEMKANQDQVMRVGNVLFDKHHKIVKDVLGGGQYGKKLFKKDLYAAYKVSPKNIVVHGHVIPQDDFLKINKIKEIEFEILQTYSSLFKKYANKWNRIDPSIPFDDYYQECMTAAMASIWGFFKPNVKFITYLVWSIDKRMISFTNENKPLSPWSANDKQLIKKVNKLRKTNPAISFEEIIDVLKLNDEERLALSSMNTKVCSQSTFVKKDKDEGAAVGIFSAVDHRNLENNLKFDQDQMAKIRNINFTSWERVVLEAYLKGDYGWATAVADSNINPETGKPYSRRAPKLALDRVFQRIREELKEVA